MKKHTKKLSDDEIVQNAVKDFYIVLRKHGCQKLSDRSILLILALPRAISTFFASRQFEFLNDNEDKIFTK